jgi:hypothetical protein
MRPRGSPHGTTVLALAGILAGCRSGGSGAPTLSLVAGHTGGPGDADGVGADARFSYLSGVASDGAGNVYVADNGIATIRKVVIATGLVTTLAGAPGVRGSADGAGAEARFSTRQGLASDGAGNLYVADTYTVRKTAIATGFVTTLAGAPGIAVVPTAWGRARA